MRKYKILCLCKRGTRSLIGSYQWVDDYHVVLSRTTSSELDALITVVEQNLKGRDPNEIWWVSESEDEYMNIPKDIKTHIAEAGIHVIHI